MERISSLEYATRLYTFQLHSFIYITQLQTIKVTSCMQFRRGSCLCNDCVQRALKGQKDTQIRSCRFWVEVCRVSLGWVETGFHTWANLFRAMTQSDWFMKTNSIWDVMEQIGWEGLFMLEVFKWSDSRDTRQEQDAVNLRTLQASVASVTSAADTVVGDAITNHASILNREIRTKSFSLDPQGTATKNFSMGGQYCIAGLPDPTREHEAVNLRTLNREIRANNLLESLKYLRLDGENQMVLDLQMNDHKLVGLADAVRPTDGVNKKFWTRLLIHAKGILII